MSLATMEFDAIDRQLILGDGRARLNAEERQTAGLHAMQRSNAHFDPMGAQPTNACMHAYS